MILSPSRTSRGIQVYSLPVSTRVSGNDLAGPRRSRFSTSIVVRRSPTSSTVTPPSEALTPFRCSRCQIYGLGLRKNSRYSAVKTSIGLMRAALKPGIEHESTAIAITTATASAIVAGSPARPPNRSEPHHPDSHADRARPAAEPNPPYPRPPPPPPRGGEPGAGPRGPRPPRQPAIRHAHHADDRRRWAARAAAAVQLLADRTLLGIVGRRPGTTHHDHGRRGGGVPGRDQPAIQERNAHGGKEAGADGRPGRKVLRRAGRNGLVQQVEVVDVAEVVGWQRAGEPCCGHAVRLGGTRLDPAPERLDVRGSGVTPGRQ